MITDEDYIQFVMRMGDKPPQDPIPMVFRYYFKRWLHSVRRLQPPRL